MIDFNRMLVLLESSGMTSADFTGLSQDERMAQGRDIGEPFIRAQLRAHGLDIKEVPPNLDIDQKVDGMLDGKPIQIKLRRSGRDERNDISYEVCRNHDRGLPLEQQLLTKRQQGRDFKGQVEKYYVMNRGETEIYEAPAPAIKRAVLKAIAELNRSRNGILSRPFASSDGTELRPTIDRDPKSFTPYKVMAFVPVDNVVSNSYPIDPNVKAESPLIDRQRPVRQAPAAPAAPAPRRMPFERPEFLQHAEDAKATGSKTFPIGSTQPRKKAEKIDDAKKFGKMHKLQVTINPDDTITFSA